MKDATDLPKLLMCAVLAQPRPSVAALGVAYALAISDIFYGPEDWQSLHQMIRSKFQPADDKAWLKLLDRIKTEGWKIYEAASAINKVAA